MTKRRAKQIAWRHAAVWLQNWLDAGYPYEMVGQVDPEENDADLERIHKAMQEIVDFCKRMAT